MAHFPSLFEIPSLRGVLQKCEPRKPELSEDDAQIVAGGRQDRVHRIAGTTEQVVAAHQTVVFRMSDDRFDGIAPFERAM